MKSHLTPDEAAALQESALHRKTPFLIMNVSHTQFSVARYSMGCTYNGETYVYVPPTDELIRADVVKWLAKYRRDAKKTVADKQGKLF